MTVNTDELMLIYPILYHITVQQVGLAYGPIRACSYSYTAQAAGPQRSPRKASLTPGSADAMREKSMFAAYIDASVGHS